MSLDKRIRLHSSPFTFRTVDAEIIHLERVLCAEGANSFFAKSYWRKRVLQASATSGLAPNQQRRLFRLLERIDAS
jgi:hypothetical protein